MQLNPNERIFPRLLLKKTNYQGYQDELRHLICSGLISLEGTSRTRSDTLKDEFDFGVGKCTKSRTNMFKSKFGDPNNSNVLNKNENTLRSASRSNFLK